MTIFNLITLFGGLALFLYGMRLMGDGLKKGSSDAFKRAMEKVTNNPLVGFLLGLVVTAVIQSSTATIVLTSGLVGAGVMSLHQSIGVILGANVGTTITGQIIRLLDVNASETSLLNFFKPSTLAPLAAIIGILFLMAVKTRQSDTIGSIAMGFGILFTGLLSMTAAVSPLSESETFANMFYQLSGKPVLILCRGEAALLLNDPLDGDAAHQLTALPAETAAHCGLVPYRAVGTESGLLLYFRPDRVLEADGKTLDCVCAAGPPGFESGQYEGLICV